MGLLNRLKKYDNLFFALRSRKVIIGASMFLFFLLFGLIGPSLAPYPPNDMNFLFNPMEAPSGDHWMGTTYIGQDVFSQLLYGLQNTIAVGFLGGIIGTFIGLLVGFFAGYYGGKLLDELLMFFTNILLVIPVIAVITIVGCYLPVRGWEVTATLIGFTNWPWVARAVRAQTLSLKNRDFVNLSRISALPTGQILFKDIAKNMLSYNVMVFILQFQGAILTSVGYDVLGLGAPDSVSIGQILYWANQSAAVQLGTWWWPFFPGVVVTLLITSLFLVNTGLHEVFNPKLREM